MGLCKCPKRRVTNQFCFEHRVNVCEYCMVTNHPKCIVQSYLQWLQDSDYNPVCGLCSCNLQDDECIRLTCYHVFHWSCAEGNFRSLPPTTAPAGYKCPTCSASVFPAPNLVSPVADVLRERLAGVNWARAGLGLPLLSEDQDLKGSAERKRSQNDKNYFPKDALTSPPSQRGTPVGASDDDTKSLVVSELSSHSIVQMQDDSGVYNSSSVNRSEGSQLPRKVFQNVDQTTHVSSYDHDEDKYKQKSTFTWIMRWWKNSLSSSRPRRPGGVSRKYWIPVLIVVAVVIVLLLLTSIERETDEDPFGSLLHNNARIVQKN